ncbi:hypothetical protein FRC07_003087 [Ceratobasidium sp. 392]|nr:hypothetical protein FRC07_003087 [Ceratobasidium sp. 392]
MPDQFQPYPSPTSSGGSPAQTQVVDPALLMGGAGWEPAAAWAFDPLFDTMYQNLEPDSIPELSDEDLLFLQSIVDIPPESEPPLFQGPSGSAGTSQMNLFSTSTNTRIVPPFDGFGSNVPLPHQPAAYSQPRRAHPAQLSPLAVNPQHTLPSPPYTAYPHQMYQPRPYQQPQQQQLPVRRHPASQMNPPGPRQPERMALPAPGDLDVSMCEVIM